MAASAGRDFAIIGAGVAGVSCAGALSRGLADGDAEVETRVHLIDQGSRGIGGHASSSRPTAHDEPIAFEGKVEELWDAAPSMFVQQPY